MSPPSEKASSPDPLADLDDDLGDDWESAFQAEDFMLSSEDDSADFFLSDDDQSHGDDIADLFNQAEDNKGGTPGATQTKPDQAPQAAVPMAFPGRLQILTAALLQLIQGRSLVQRLLLIGLPALLLLLVIATFFFQTTSDQLAALDEDAQPTTPGDPSAPAHAPEPSSALSADLAAVPETVEDKWVFPSFIIVASTDDSTSIVVSIDLTLNTIHPKGQDLPLEQETFVRDTIYQFYRNRPPYELRRFALARHDMISQLMVWLNKQWPDNPVATITFTRYHVIQTKPDAAPGDLTPKNTFM